MAATGSVGLAFCVCFVFHCVHQGLAYSNDTSLKFLVMGDWGGLPVFPYRTIIEKAVADRMGDIAQVINPKFILALGDNFYYDGVKNVDDPRFKETFEQVYTAKSLQINWYLVAGNHDHRGNVTAEIAYSQKSARWNFPNYYYSLKFDLPGGKSTLQILMIDTVVLCGNTDSDFDKEPPQGPEDEPLADTQWQWIEDNIKHSKAEYLIVAGHYPVISVAEHGPTKCLVDKLMPMLHKYKVTAYFSGHDHNLQHLQLHSYNQTVDYFVSGSANFIDPSLLHRDSVPPGSLKFHWADITHLGGFAHVEADQNSMTWTFIQANGKTLYRQTMTPRKV